MLIPKLLKRKRALRIDRDIPAVIFDEAGEWAPTVVLNASETGFRLKSTGVKPLPVAAVLLVIEKAEAHQISRVWSDHAEAGFEVIRSCSVRAFVDPGFAQAKEFWARAVQADVTLAKMPLQGARAAR